MNQKLMLVIATSLLLGGCTINNSLNTDQSATDVRSPESTTSTTIVSPSSPDTNLEQAPSLKTGDDIKSLEDDLEKTIIQEEDFSDL